MLVGLMGKMRVGRKGVSGGKVGMAVEGMERGLQLGDRVGSLMMLVNSRGIVKVRIHRHTRSRWVDYSVQLVRDRGRMEVYIFCLFSVYQGSRPGTEREEEVDDRSCLADCSVTRVSPTRRFPRRPSARFLRNLSEVS